MKVTFRHNVHVNEDGQVSFTTEVTDLPQGYDLTVPTVTFTRAQSAQLAGMVLSRHGMVCAWCGKAPPVASDHESD